MFAIMYVSYFSLRVRSNAFFFTIFSILRWFHLLILLSHIFLLFIFIFHISLLGENKAYMSCFRTGRKAPARETTEPYLHLGTLLQHRHCKSC